MKHAPIPTFSPYKGIIDRMGPLFPKKKEEVKQEEEEDGGFEMERDGGEEDAGEFKVENVDDEDAPPKTEEKPLTSNLAMFFMKKTVVEANLTDEDAMYESMGSRVDSMLVPKDASPI